MIGMRLKSLAAIFWHSSLPTKSINAAAAFGCGAFFVMAMQSVMTTAPLSGITISSGRPFSSRFFMQSLITAMETAASPLPKAVNIMLPLLK